MNMSPPTETEPAFTPEELENAYATIRGSGLILAKLDIGYGFVGHSEDSIRRMYELKGRPESNPCVVPGNIPILRELCLNISEPIYDWLRDQMAWTTISVVADLNEDSTLWQSLPEYVRQQSSKDKTVAVFLKPGPFLEALVEEAHRNGHLLAGSSGNQSGKGNSYRPDELPDELKNGVDMFIDHGIAKHEHPNRIATTMIDLRTLEIIRVGVNHDQIKENLQTLKNQVEGD